MEFQNISLCRHFCMQGNHASAGPIIVYKKIMHPAYLFMCKHNLFNLRHKFCLRRLP